MSRPRFEVADVLRLHGDAFLRAHPQPPHVCSALNLIRLCRTAALDGHLDRCPDCGAWFSVDLGPQEALEVRVGVSYRSAEGASSNLEAEIPEWGFSASPLLVDGRLLLELGGALVFCDPETGEVRARAGDASWGAYSNPMPFELEGRPLLALFAQTGLVVHDRTTGEVLWKHRWRSNPGINTGTPIIGGFL